MPHTATLDPADARPLTSREISKVLCSIIAGVVVFDGAARQAVPAVLAAVQREESTPAVSTIGWTERNRRRPLKRSDRSGYVPEASWAVALSATVAGLRGWCTPTDITTALNWVSEHLHEICPPEHAVAPSN